MSQLTLNLLGDLEVIRDGVVLPLPPSKKTRALLAYLALQDRSFRREALCELLWEVPDDPRGSLRWSLSKLRRLVDEPDRPRVVADRSTVRFDREGLEVDLLLLRWSKHEDFTVRAAALVGLAGRGDRHLALLRGIVRDDPDHFVRRQIVKHLGGFRDRATAAAVVAYYADCQQRNDRRGAREAERTLVKMSGSPVARRGRLIHYGLAHWQKWVLTLPVDGGNE